jgi:hypothetical protein
MTLVHSLELKECVRALNNLFIIRTEESSIAVIYTRKYSKEKR